MRGFGDDDDDDDHRLQQVYLDEGGKGGGESGSSTVQDRMMGARMEMVGSKWGRMGAAFNDPPFLYTIPPRVCLYMRVRMR